MYCHAVLNGYLGILNSLGSELDSPIACTLGPKRQARRINIYTFFPCLDSSPNRNDIAAIAPKGPSHREKYSVDWILHGAGSANSYPNPASLYRLFRRLSASPTRSETNIGRRDIIPLAPAPNCRTFTVKSRVSIIFRPQIACQS